jgi:hypothetical protein
VHNYQIHPIKSSFGPVLLGHLLYEYFLIMYSIQSIILSYFGALKYGIYLWRIPMCMRNIRRFNTKRIRKEGNQDGGKL